MEKTTLLVEENDLHGLKLFGEFASSNVRVDVKDLTVRRFRQAGEDG